MQLTDAVAKLCAEMQTTSQAEITLDLQTEDLRLSPDEEDAVYRSVQEGITNAIRHGHATAVRVRIAAEERRLGITVTDNGCGCAKIEPGFGLRHMRERLRLLNGTLKVKSEKDLNCTRKFRCDGVMYMIKVLLADDQELIRESLGFVLGAQGDITVVGMAKNGREAIELVRSEKPDVVLMDIRMPEVDGVECTRLIKSAHPNIKVIVLTTFDDDEYVFNALRFGASGYLLKGVSVADLTNAVREVVRGGSIIAPDVASKALEMFARMAKGNLLPSAWTKKQTEDLQDNEWRIIREVGAGLSNKEIAAALCLSEGTVRNYLSSILSKLELRDRTQLAIWAVQTGVAGRPFGGPL